MVASGVSLRSVIVGTQPTGDRPLSRAYDRSGNVTGDDGRPTSSGARPALRLRRAGSDPTTAEWDREPDGLYRIEGSLGSDRHAAPSFLRDRAALESREIGR